MTSNTKSHVFLIELTIAILVFALAAAIVLRLFVKADQTSSRSQLTTIALAISQSIAEQVKASESPSKEPDGTQYYDQSGVLVQDRAEAAFQIQTSITQENRNQGIMATVTIIAEIVSPAFSGSPSDQQEPLLSLTVKKYFSGEEAIR